MPRVPEKYFWRVIPGALSMTYLQLRKRLGKFSTKVDDRVLHYYDENRNVLDPSREMIRAARSIMKEFNDPWPAYHGDYPPKKLEKNS